MRAVQITAVNRLEIAEVADPEPKPGEVLVRIRAAALNHRDVWIKVGQYAGLKWPCIPGSDGAGVVVAASRGVDPGWLGREVVINPSFDWGESERAQGKSFSILGLPRDGTLAEMIAVPVAQLAAKPKQLSWEEAAALPLAGLTAWRAVSSRGGLKHGERVLISGIGGGVAVYALQFAVPHGAEVWVTSGSAEKIARAAELGAKGGANYAEPEWAAGLAKRAGGGFDLIVDSAGGPGFESLLDLAAPGGRIVIYGATRGNPPVLPMRKIFWRQLSVLGTTMGSPGDWNAMTSYVAQYGIKPVVHSVVPLARAGEAFDLMERGGQFGKIVVTMA
ncbi:MAG TPA: zinc-binding dehydrogenase [Opitutus sp.]|nr:zinc-binding dehydrogenase [Opitutus sp.]